MQEPEETRVPPLQGGGGEVGWGRAPGEGNDNPLQYSSLETSMGRGAWGATIHGIAKSWI